MTQFNQLAGWKYHDVRIPVLAAGDTHFCTMEFDVVGDVGSKIHNYAAIAEANEYIFKNNESHIRDIIIQASK